MESNNTNAKLVTRWEYLMVLLMLFMSGNGWWKATVTEYCFVIYALVLFVLYFGKIQQERELFRNMKIYYLVILLIFACQTIVFHWNSFPAIVNYCAKMFIGCTVYILLGDRFKHVYLRLMYPISIFCIICWLLQITVWPDIGFLRYGESGSMLFFNHRANEPIRNCGFFWEPGAYGCYLLLVPIFFFNQLDNLWKYYRKECIVLLIALLSTQSTTAYMSFGILIGLYLLLQMKGPVKYILIILFSSISIYAYTTLEFLQEKINMQTENSLEKTLNEDWSSDRLGSLLFDIYYIEKHPIVGNGLNEKTNWADHMWIWEAIHDGQLSKSGNGLSGWIRQFGFGGILLFSYLFFRRNKLEQKKDVLQTLILLFMLLLGEPLYIYPTFMGIPFLNLRKDTNNFLI